LERSSQVLEDVFFPHFPLSSSDIVFHFSGWRTSLDPLFFFKSKPVSSQLLVAILFSQNGSFESNFFSLQFLFPWHFFRLLSLKSEPVLLGNFFLFPAGSSLRGKLE